MTSGIYGTKIRKSHRQGKVAKVKYVENQEQLKCMMGSGVVKGGGGGDEAV